MSLYQVSENKTVLTFTQNQKAPNKPGQRLADSLERYTRQGIPYDIVKDMIDGEYQALEDSGKRGIESVSLSFQESHSKYQEHRSIYLSYRLNGTFATYTEYAPAAEEKEDQE